MHAYILDGTVDYLPVSVLPFASISDIYKEFREEKRSQGLEEGRRGRIRTPYYF